MNFLLSLVTGRAGVAVLVLAAIVVANGAGYVMGHKSGFAKGDAGRAAVQARWDAERIALLDAASKKEAEYRDRERQAALKTQEISDEAQVSKAAAAAAVVRARTAGERLLDRAAAADASRCGGVPEAAPAAASGASAPDATRVLADLRRRLVEAAGLYAAVADARGGAGRACERYGDEVGR